MCLAIACVGLSGKNNPILLAAHHRPSSYNQLHSLKV